MAEFSSEAMGDVIEKGIFEEVTFKLRSKDENDLVLQRIREGTSRQRSRHINTQKKP